MVLEERLPLFQRLAQRDTTRSKHGGTRASEIAHKRLVPGKLRKLLEYLRLYRQAGGVGLTAKELAAKTGKKLHEISGRQTELRQWGFIIKCDAARRDNATVHVHRRFILHHQAAQT